MAELQERQFAQHEAMLADSDPLYIPIVVLAYRRLLAYFDENELAVADAIRYGIKETDPVPGAIPWHPRSKQFRIIYPEQTDTES